MSTTKTWFGGVGHFNAAKDWTPTGAPHAGEVAVVDAGTLIAEGGTLNGVAFDLEATIDLANETLTQSAAILVGILEQTNQHYDGSMTIAGLVRNQGDIFVGTLSAAGYPNPTGTLQIALAPDAVLDNGPRQPGNSGSDIVAQNASTLDLTGGAGSVLVNDGTIMAVGATLDIGVPVVGTGTLESSGGGPEPIGTLELGSYVSPGETIGLNEAGVVQLDHPSTFLGSFAFFAPESHIVLANTTATSDTFIGGELTVFDGKQVVAAFAVGNTPSVTSVDVQQIGANAVLTPVQSAPALFAHSPHG